MNIGDKIRVSGAYNYGQTQPKKESPRLENAVKRTENTVSLNNNEVKTLTYEIPQVDAGRPTAKMEISSDGSSGEKTVRFALTTKPHPSAFLNLNYTLKETAKKELVFVQAEVFECTAKFGLALCKLAAEKNILLPLIEKTLNSETNPNYKRYLQAIYDGVSLVK